MTDHIYFTAEKNKVSSEITQQTDWCIRYRPAPGEGGISAPVLILSDLVAEPEHEANRMALMLNSHNDLVATLEAVMADVQSIDNDSRLSLEVGQKLKASLAKVRR